MSELIQKNDNRNTIRWKLLTGASALALTVSFNVAKAEDSSQPTIWIEADGQFARQDANTEAFLPPFLYSSQFDGLSQINRKAPSVWDEGGKISFQPEDTDWVLSAGIRFGKASRHASQIQITAQGTPGYGVNFTAYQDFSSSSIEGHTIVDFQVGKDVGLGKFGSGGHSLLGLGVRFAQFNSKSNISIHSQPTNVVRTHYRYYASFAADRKFRGLGPSLSWDASANIAGNGQDGSISLDWGVNGAVLFGRQQARVHRQVMEKHTFITFSRYIQHIDPVYTHSASPDRSKSVAVPNLGAFAGVSWRTPNAKVNFGYRADMFFGTIDGGIDAAKKENRSFNGPYASISIGLP